ncbi:MAG TPA: hypothetical protein VEA59_03915 [Patescibacteria group bacterium]|nr:hypothetical protein [Patescibacteria group bacterium]
MNRKPVKRNVLYVEQNLPQRFVEVTLEYLLKQLPMHHSVEVLQADLKFNGPGEPYFYAVLSLAKRGSYPLLLTTQVIEGEGPNRQGLAYIHKGGVASTATIGAFSGDPQHHAHYYGLTVLHELAHVHGLVNGSQYQHCNNVCVMHKSRADQFSRRVLALDDFFCERCRYQIENT